MHEVVVLPDGLDLPSPDTFAAMVSTIAGRLREFARLNGQALREESWRTARTSRDWAENLLNLEAAAAPLIQLFEGIESCPQAQELTPLAEGMNYFRSQMNRAVAALRQEGDDMTRQHRAIDFVRRSEIGLNRWLEQLGTPPDGDFAYQSSLPSEQGVLWEFEYGMTALDDALRSNCPIEICMASRKQFLRAYYMAVVQPQLWTDERHAELVRKHADCLVALPPGIERDSVAKRHAKLQEYSPQGFTERALQLIM